MEVTEKVGLIRLMSRIGCILNKAVCKGVMSKELYFQQPIFEREKHRFFLGYLHTYLWCYT